MKDIEVVATEFEVAGEILHGNFVKPTGEGPFPGICKFHGLPGSSDQVHGIAMSLANEGFLVLTFDFRGFRQSEGLFSLSGEIDDAKASVTQLLDSGWARQDWVGVYGASFGAAVAVCAAVRDKRVAAVCLRAPVYNTEKLVDSNLVDLILQDIMYTIPDEMHGITNAHLQQDLLARLREDAAGYNPMKEIYKISPRGLFITSGDADALIDVKGVRALYEQAGEPKELVIVRGADHNLSRDTPRIETERGVIDWFRQQVDSH